MNVVHNIAVFLFVVVLAQVVLSGGSYSNIPLSEQGSFNSQNPDSGLTQRVETLEDRVQLLENILESGYAEPKTSAATGAFGSYGQCDYPHSSSQCLDMWQSSCSGSWVSGLCPGGSNIRCCVESQPSETSCYSPYSSHRCLNVYSDSCDGTFVSGYCPGDSSIRCCVTGGSTPGSGKLSHNEALSRLQPYGIPVRSSGGCSDRYQRTCTSLDQVRSTTIDGIIAFKNECGCSVTITGGTETGHASGTYSHWEGYKLDIALGSPDATIMSYSSCGTRSDGAACYQDSRGYKYYRESSHWDILFA